MYLVTLLIALPLAAQTPALYDYHLSGNREDVHRETSAGLLLSGGAGDVAEAFKWFLGKAGNGDVVVLRASGSDGYNQYLPSVAAVDSVETFVTKSREASYDQFLLERLSRAEAIFLAGGDQWNYIRMWKDTPVEDAIHSHYRARRPVGGTSAGLAVMGEWLFSAQHDTVTSGEALGNPFSEKITITSEFLNFPPLRNAITDSHFARRDRMGRLIVFLARILALGHSDARGIGVDEGTAVLVEPAGLARVVGKANVYFVRVRKKPERYVPGEALSMTQVSVRKAAPNGQFDLRKWRGGEHYTLSVHNGRIGVRRKDGSLY